MHFCIVHRARGSLAFQLVLDDGGVAVTGAPQADVDACTRALREVVVVLREGGGGVRAVKSGHRVTLTGESGAVLAESAALAADEASALLTKIRRGVAEDPQLRVIFPPEQRGAGSSQTDMERPARYDLDEPSQSGRGGLELLRRASDDLYTGHFNDADGRAVVFMRGYAARNQRDEHARALVQVMAEARRYRREDGDGGVAFVVTARNGREMARSRWFESWAACEAAIASLVAAAPAALAAIDEPSQVKSVAGYLIGRASNGEPGFESFRGDDRRHYFHLNDERGAALLFSHGYSSSRERDAGMRAVIRVAMTRDSYQVRGEQAPVFFVVLAGNSRELVRSREFESVEAAQAAIRWVTGAITKLGSEAGVRRPATMLIAVSEDDVSIDPPGAASGPEVAAEQAGAAGGAEAQERTATIPRRVEALLAGLRSPHEAASAVGADGVVDGGAAGGAVEPAVEPAVERAPVVRDGLSELFRAVVAAQSPESGRVDAGGAAARAAQFAEEDEELAVSTEVGATRHAIAVSDEVATFEPRGTRAEAVSEAPVRAGEVAASEVPAAEVVASEGPKLAVETVASEAPAREPVVSEEPVRAVEAAASEEPTRAVETVARGEPEPAVEPVVSEEPKPAVAPVASEEPTRAVETTMSEELELAFEAIGIEEPKPAVEVAASEEPKPAVGVAASEEPKPAVEVAASEAPKPAVEVAASEAPKIEAATVAVAEPKIEAAAVASGAPRVEAAPAVDAEPVTQVVAAEPKREPAVKAASVGSEPAKVVPAAPVLGAKPDAKSPAPLTKIGRVPVLARPEIKTRAAAPSAEVVMKRDAAKTQPTPAHPPPASLSGRFPIVGAGHEPAKPQPPRVSSLDVPDLTPQPPPMIELPRNLPPPSFFSKAQPASPPAPAPVEVTDAKRVSPAVIMRAAAEPETSAPRPAKPEVAAPQSTPEVATRPRSPTAPFAVIHDAVPKPPGRSAAPTGSQPALKKRRASDGTPPADLYARLVDDLAAEDPYAAGGAESGEPPHAPPLVPASAPPTPRVVSEPPSLLPVGPPPASATARAPTPASRLLPPAPTRVAAYPTISPPMPVAERGGGRMFVWIGLAVLVVLGLVLGPCASQSSPSQPPRSSQVDPSSRPAIDPPATLELPSRDARGPASTDLADAPLATPAVALACPTRAGDDAVGVLVSPFHPAEGEPLRVLAATLADEAAIDVQILGPDHKPVAQASTSRAGLPSTALANATLAAGEYTAVIGRDGQGVRCEAFTVTRSKKMDRPRQTSGAWPVDRAWSQAEEALYSAWLRALFDAPDDAELRFAHLDRVVGDARRNVLHDALRWGEDSRPGLRLRPDSADLAYSLRAYWAWKRRLPFAFHTCSRGEYGSAPRCTSLHSNLDVVADAPPSSLERMQRYFQRTLAYGVHTGNARTAHGDEHSDFYPVALARSLLRPGTIYADPHGHILTIVDLRPPGEGHDGVLLAVDAQPDGTITRKHFWRGAFLWDSDPKLGGAGFKRFRPVVARGGAVVPVGDAEVAATRADLWTGWGALTGDEFYAKIDELVTPGPRDASRVQGDLVDALAMAVRGRVDAVERSSAYAREHGAIAMPKGYDVFETIGPWESHASPGRDLRLLISLDVVVGFAERAATDTAVYRTSAGETRDGLRERLVDERARMLADPERGFSYRRSDGSHWPLTLAALAERAPALEVAYNPNDCPEVRWGAPAGSDEASTCTRRAAADQRARMERYRGWFKDRTPPPRRDAAG